MMLLAQSPAGCLMMRSSFRLSLNLALKPCYRYSSLNAVFKFHLLGLVPPPVWYIMKDFTMVQVSVCWCSDRSLKMLVVVSLKWSWWSVHAAWEALVDQIFYSLFLMVSEHLHVSVGTCCTFSACLCVFTTATSHLTSVRDSLSVSKEEKGKICYFTFTEVLFYTVSTCLICVSLSWADTKI